MKRNLFILFALLLCSVYVFAEDEEDRPPVYSYTNEVTFSQTGNDQVNRLIVLLTMPSSNEYQTVWKVTPKVGKLISELRCGNSLLYLDSKSLPTDPFDVGAVIDVETKTVETDFSKIDIKPYDPESEACKLYLEDYSNIINTKNENVREIGDMLWERSKDIIDYARNCYEYAASNLQFDEVNDWQSIAKILDRRSGGPSDFSTLVVNLLRYKGIPSRHNVCVTFGQQYHCFVDFYLEGYGWVPVDPMLKNEHPDGDFFGKYNGNFIVLSQDIHFNISVYLPEIVTFVPTYYCYYTTTGPDCYVTISPNLTYNGLSAIHRVTEEQHEDSRLYDLNGHQVSSSYKGVVISKGHKYINK